MASSIICHACGAKLTVPDDYPRNKMPCSACGVIVELPPGRPKKKPAAASPPAAPKRRAPVRRISTQEELPPELEEALFSAEAPTCPRCGDPLPGGQANRCPRCNPPLPISRTALQKEPRPQPPELGEISDDEWDSKPYGVTGGVPLHCPNCQREMEEEAQFCVHCGYDRETGAKAKQLYTPLARHWQTGWPYRARFQAFLALQGLCVLLLIGSIVADEIGVFLGSWLVFTGMTAFLLGTYDSVDLTRKENGKVRLVHTWYLCFFERPPESIRLRDFEGVATGKEQYAGCWEWIVFFFLFTWLFVPGIIWWYFAIHRESLFVALTRYHGSVDLILFRCRHEDKALEMADTLRDVMMVERS